MARQILNHTALRGLTASAVCWGHYTDVFARDVGGINFFLPHTHLGVDMFFLLSGFIMFYVYGAVFAGPRRVADWGQFLRRRLLRIYPLHLATLLLVIAIQRFALPPDGLRQLGLNLSLTHAWGFTDSFIYNAPSWSISAEFAAYLLFPAMAVFVVQPLGRVALAAVVVGSALVLWALGAGSFDLEAIGRTHVMFRLFFSFPLGVLLAWAFLAGYRPSPALASLLQLGGLVGLAVVLAMGWAELWMVLAFAVLVFATAGDEGVFAPLLRLSPLQWLGKVSYGIYLLQWPLMLVMFNLEPKLAPLVGGFALDALRAGIFLVLLLGGAALSWRWLEAPLLALGRRPAAIPAM